MNTDRLVIPVPRVRSLVWDGDTLVDWVGGGTRIDLTGRVVVPKVYFPFRFDSVQASPDGRFSVIYERFGTKALLLDRGDIARELDRSWYHADSYEFPITFIPLPDGQTALAHCPRGYDRIDIECAETGLCLTGAVERKPEDVFHSRLLSSPSGKWIASAGWMWHPFDVAHVWSVVDALRDPTLLDGQGVDMSIQNEVCSLAFLNDDQIAVATGGEDVEGDSCGPVLSVMNATDGSEVTSCPLARPAGTMFFVDAKHLLCLYQHPRLIAFRSGAVAREWGDLETGTQTSSIIAHSASVPPYAKHPTEPLFAVANHESVTIIRLEA